MKFTECLQEDSQHHWLLGDSFELWNFWSSWYPRIAHRKPAKTSPTTVGLICVVYCQHCHILLNKNAHCTKKKICPPRKRQEIRSTVWSLRIYWFSDCARGFSTSLSLGDGCSDMKSKLLHVRSFEVYDGGGSFYAPHRDNEKGFGQRPWVPRPGARLCAWKADLGSQTLGALESHELASWLLWFWR